MRKLGWEGERESYLFADILLVFSFLNLSSLHDS